MARLVLVITQARTFMCLHHVSLYSRCSQDKRAALPSKLFEKATRSWALDLPVANRFLFYSFSMFPDQMLCG